MPHKDPEAKRAADRRYREENREKVAACKKRWSVANAERIRRQKKEAYEANKPAILARQKEHRRRRRAADGGEHERRRTREWRTRNIEKARASARLSAARLYRADPLKAALKRAKTIIVQQTGLAFSEVPRDLAEAKAHQLLAQAAIRRPGMAVGERKAEEQRKAERAAYWQRWYAANKDRLSQERRAARAAKARPTQ